MVAFPLVNVYNADSILFVIGGGLGVLMICSLALMYFMTFRELKKTLEKTSEHKLSICTQLVYIGVLTVLASLQMSLSFT
jgi:cell division protein FtsW (lipid II flippase)